MEVARSYKISPPRQTEERAPAKTPKRTAILVTHGMGQQVPFETIAQVVDGLKKAEIRKSGHQSVDVEFDCVPAVSGEPLRRAKMMLMDGSNEPMRKVDVFEAYWAPLMGGAVGLFDVLVFLWHSGINGLKNGLKPFRRYLFEVRRELPSELFSVIALIAILLALVCLVALGVEVFSVLGFRFLAYLLPEGRFPAVRAPFVRDATFPLEILLVWVGGFLLTLVLSRNRAVRRIREYSAIMTLKGGGFAGKLAGLMCFGMVLVAMACAFIIPGVWAWHSVVRDEQGPWQDLVGLKRLDTFGEWFVGLFFAIVAVVVIVKALNRIPNLLLNPWRTTQARFVRFFLLGAFLFVLSWVGLHFAFIPFLCSDLWEVLQRRCSWLFVAVILWFGRRFLIEYMGDVAVYLDSFRVDRFFDLRRRIRDEVARVAESVYALRENGEGSPFCYDRVVVVGHSLGSVVAYDVLNRLLLFDDLDKRAGVQIGIANRTSAFITFGSPLDKIAFLLSLQPKEATEAREALISTGQPLLRDYCFRPESWVNLYSKWDPISGHLDFFDAEDGSAGRKKIDNKIDPYATTPLLAHVEYWEGPTLYEIIHKAAVA